MRVEERLQLRQEAAEMLLLVEGALFEHLGEEFEEVVSLFGVLLAAVCGEAGEEAVEEGLEDRVSEEEAEEEVACGAFGGVGHFFADGEAGKDEVPFESLAWVCQISNYKLFNFFNSALKFALFKTFSKVNQVDQGLFDRELSAELKTVSHLSHQF